MFSNKKKTQESYKHIHTHTHTHTHIYIHIYISQWVLIWASLVAQLVKNPPATWKTWVWSLSREDPLEKGMATHSSILAWRMWVGLIETVEGLHRTKKLSLLQIRQNLSYLTVFRMELKHQTRTDIFLPSDLNWNMSSSWASRMPDFGLKLHHWFS